MRSDIGFGLKNLEVCFDELVMLKDQMLAQELASHRQCVPGKELLRQGTATDPDCLPHFSCHIIDLKKSSRSSSSLAGGLAPDSSSGSSIGATLNGSSSS